MSGVYKRIQKFSHTKKEWYRGRHRFEHWYVSNQVYFITARCRDRKPAFASEQAKAVFWDRFAHYTATHGFTPWVTSLLDNHYHTLGYCKDAGAFKTMMQRLHGSVAKLTNDLLDDRLLPFWRDAQGRDYFDGCIRDVLQCRRAYRYTLLQAARHGLVADYRAYPHTRVDIDLERGICRAVDLGAFLEGLPYARYERNKPPR